MRAAALIAASAVTATLVAAAPASAAPSVHQQVLQVPVGAEPGGATVSLDATLWTPSSASAAHPAPAVLLAHGFGGTKASVAGEARTLAQHGYVVLAWTARGFGASGGMVHLDSPTYEVADVSRLVDLLGRRSDVRRDGPGDPRVGVAGASYGGAVGLLAAGADPRIDAVASAITWDDLGSALDPQSVVGAPADAGVYKAGWAAQLLSSLAGPGAANPACGRLAADLCAGYLKASETGQVSSALRAQLSASAPARALTTSKAPVLLVQGESDSLFGLQDSLTNAHAAQAAGVPVALDWVPGGHDGGLDTSDVTSRTLTWFDRYLEHPAGSNSASRSSRAATTRFEADVPVTSGGANASATTSTRTSSSLPGTADQPEHTRSLALSPVTGAGAPARDGAVPILSPPGGRPAALTTLPGLGSLSALGGGVGGGGAGGGALAGLGALATPAGQVAAFQTAPLPSGATLLGASSVRLRVASTASDAVLFASLADVSPDGASVVPSGLVAPVRVQIAAGAANEVVVRLPSVVRDVAAGHRLRLLVASTDSSYAVPADPRTYTVAVASPLSAALAPRTLSRGSGDPSGVPWPQVLLFALVVAGSALLLVVDAVRRRRHLAPAHVASTGTDPAGERGEPPVLAVRDLVKTYADGFRAVDGVSFTVERGQVVGLLGPNGAGKTTTLRMLLGLLRPTSGSLEVLGRPVVPGSAVLAQVGALVEGPGFLPHLSGLENLRAFWQATGRPADEAGIDEALVVAGLGDSVHRPVRSYSQGMRQRLGIAQAMLGRPDLLVLDEPTNGLDPPQISAMREVLRSYAATGRTVLVSSHLLSEVEATCSHAVVMARGKVLAAGSVAELAGGSGEVLISVPDAQVASAAAVAASLAGVDVLAQRPGALVLDPGAAGPAPVVRALVGAGVDVSGVAPQHHLEEVFLGLVAGASTPADARTTSPARTPSQARSTS